MKRTIIACVIVALAAGASTAVAAKLITGADIKNGSITGKDLAHPTVGQKVLKKGAVIKKKLSPAVQEALAAKGTPGPQGPAGAKGEKGDPGPSTQTTVDSLNGPFEATNTSVSLTPDGVEFGPYADGAASGGSLRYTGLNGKPLSAVKNLVYYARYVSSGSTAGVGSPYLRVFLDGDTHDAIFTPNTQPPDQDSNEGPFHEWVATSGEWRYDDDPGSGPNISFAQLISAHGNETISGVYITTGFSAGADLASLLRWMEINGQTYAFGN